MVDLIRLKLLLFFGYLFVTMATHFAIGRYSDPAKVYSSFTGTFDTDRFVKTLLGFASRQRLLDKHNISDTLEALVILMKTYFFLFPQATFKASKFAVSPDLNFVLLGYDVKQVRTS